MCINTSYTQAWRRLLSTYLFLHSRIIQILHPIPQNDLFPPWSDHHIQTQKSSSVWNSCFVCLGCRQTDHSTHIRRKKKNYPIKGFVVSFPCSWCWKDPNNLCFTDTWWSLCGSLPFIAVIGLDHCFCGSWGNPSRYVLCLEFSAPGRPVPSLKEMAGHRPA